MRDKIITLMQFARKAGKLIHGFDACLRGLNNNQLKVMVFAGDVSDRSKRTLEGINNNLRHPVKVITLGTKAEISQSLGLPESGVFGIIDSNFASRIVEYWQAEA